MKHFSTTEWVDFVRNVVVAEQRMSMQEHLDQGCGSCLKVLRMWATIVEFARCERFYEPPAGAVRNAVSYFFSFGLTLRQRADLRILRHVFDSFDLCSALDGIRSSGTAPRQLMYESDGVFIDLRVEQKLGSDWMDLTGQVLDAHVTDEILEVVPVSLLSKGNTVLQTTTNQFGEFNCSFNAIGHLGLLLTMKQVALLLALPEDLAGSSMN